MEPEAARQEMALAFGLVAQRQGRDFLPAGTWINVLSLDLGWMAPGLARAYVERALAGGVLVEREGLVGLPLRRETHPPLGFRPDPHADPGSDRVDPFAQWLALVAQRTQRTREHILADVATLQRRFGGWLTAEAALLLLARENGLDTAAAIEEAARRLVAETRRDVEPGFAQPSAALAVS